MTIVTASDLKKVDKEKQTVVINDGKAYDITKFLNFHPGL